MVTIEKLLEGKSTIINNKEYLSTKKYIEPFLNFMKKFTNDFYVNAQPPKQLTITDSKQDITYNKVWVQAIMPKKCDKCGYAETYNLVYALDVKKPIYKIFKAYKDRTNNNLYVFDSQWLNVYELRSGEEFISFDNIIKHLMEKTDDSEIRFKNMLESTISSDEKKRQQKLGSLIENSMYYYYYHKGGKVKIAPQMVIKAYQNVYSNSSSRNYIGDSNESSLLNYYDAFSTLVTQDSKDILNRFEKCAVCLQILNEELWK